jgi:hypothetical protein
MMRSSPEEDSSPSREELEFGNLGLRTLWNLMVFEFRVVGFFVRVFRLKGLNCFLRRVFRVLRVSDLHALGILRILRISRILRILRMLREEDPKGWSTVPVTALGSWEKTVPRGQMFRISRVCLFFVDCWVFRLA